MDFSEDWKSLWPISSVFSAPSLISAMGGGGASSATNSKELGPLFFNPLPQTLTPLFASPSLSTLLPPPYPRLSLPKFLQTSSLLPSAAASLAPTLAPQPSHSAASTLRHNRLQLLRCNNSLLAFFPTGDNSDRIGFLLLTVKDGKLDVRGDMGNVFTSKSRLNHRILRLAVNPVADLCVNSGDFFYTTVGYVLACTVYSVHWFSVRIRGLGSDSERPVLNSLGSKLFKSSSVVHACWSPHLCEESVVLLESGELFLFDLDSCSENQGLSARFSGKRLRVRWDDSIVGVEDSGWLGCEFSWHPRILIVAHSNAVFLVDLRSRECEVSCLLRVEKLPTDTGMLEDRFVAFSKVGSDGFYFAVASGHRLLLCDVRKPLMPLLRWAHDLPDPSYVDVFPLSEMRSHSNDNTYEWASESGYCIVLGSFWNCEFSLFCYGPALRGSVAAEMSRVCKSFYAWELPSELSLSGRECPCGSCLVREEFAENALPEWIDWQQKKNIVLGFGILDKDLSAQLFEQDSFGGFTLIRLMSSGELELQRYRAYWEFQKVVEETHKESPLHFEDSLLYSVGDGEYSFAKTFQYVKLDYLNGYLKGNVAKVLSKKMKGPCNGPCEKDSFSTDCHQYICEKLKACGVNSKGSLSTVSEVFKVTSLPTTIHEIALRSTWVGLPIDLLQLAFSTYSEFLEVLVDKRKVSLEFLSIPLQPQLPPFFLQKPSCRSSKWTQKVQPGDVPVGPVLPLPVMLTLHKLREGEETDSTSADSQITVKCNEVMQVANKIAMSGSSSDAQSDHAVNLGDDRDEMCYGSQKDSCYASLNVNLFSLHKPVAFSEKLSTMDTTPDNSASEDERFTTMIFKTPEKKPVSNGKTDMVGPDMFDALCPVELKFNDCDTKFGPKELKTYNLLKKQFSKFLQGL